MGKLRIPLYLKCHNLLKGGFFLQRKPLPFAHFICGLEKYKILYWFLLIFQLTSHFEIGQVNRNEKVESSANQEIEFHFNAVILKSVCWGVRISESGRLLHFKVFLITFGCSYEYLWHTRLLYWSGLSPPAPSFITIMPLASQRSLDRIKPRVLGGETESASVDMGKLCWEIIFATWQKLQFHLRQIHGYSATPPTYEYPSQYMQYWWS